MKKIISLLAAGIVAAFSGYTAKAQISYSNALAGVTLIYSNSFTGLNTVNITNTQCDYESGTLGGKSNTNWIESLIADTNALYADGTMGTPSGDAWLMPFVPQAGYVYTMNATVNFFGSPGTWVGAGFANYHAANSISGNGRFNTGGVDFGILTESSRNIQSFAGPGATLGYASVNAIWNPSTGLHTLTQILDTTGTKWVIASFVDGVFVANTNFTYASNPTILGVGLSQNGGSAPLSQNTFKWAGFTLLASPLVITRPPQSAAVGAGTAYTNSVVVSASSPNYQWYRDGLSLPLGGQTNITIVNGATNSLLIINPVKTSDASSDYYVVATNSLGGAATSSPASLTVYGAPIFVTTYPVIYSNPFTLYAATNIGGTNYPGASPVFSVSVLGQAPIAYQWQTNGVSVGGATNTSFTFTNCQLNSPTTFTCVVTNVGGAVTNAWTATYIPSSSASFANAVMTNKPVGFWRLNEGPDDGNGDFGLPALDVARGNNGLYTNAYLGNAAYTNTDPAAASVRFDYAGNHSDVFGIQGIDFSNSPSATFTVQAWANGFTGQASGAGIITKGYNGGEQFGLDVAAGKFRFVVRNANGTASTATAATGPDGNWHFLVGVCDEVNGTVSLYVDGLLAGASAPITPGSGILGNFTPISIGARGAAAGDLDSLQFSGYISDCAIYNTALPAINIANLYSAAGFPVGFAFVPPLPPTNCVFLANITTNISATIFAQTVPSGYYWTNLTTGSVMASGSTNVAGNLIATLVLTNPPASLSGDLLELVVTNAVNTTNWFVTLFSPAPPIALDYSSPILYSNFFNGGTWSVGGMPLTAANLLYGGTNALWVDALGTNATGMLEGNGGSTATIGDSWLLPFKPHPGYIYTVEASVTLPSYPGSWVGVGFASVVPTNTTTGRFSDTGGNAPNGYAWQIDTAGGTQNLQAFQGAGGNGQCVNINNFYPALPTTITNDVVLDTTGSNWVASFYVNGVLGGSTNYPATNPPPIGAVGLTQNSLTLPGFIQWNYFSVTQVASSAPPYLITSLPSSVTLAANSTLSLPATGFSSSAPYGYYWGNTNTVAVLQSGTTNNVAPLLANLASISIPGSWNGNKLALVLTNAYGTNISLVTLTVTNSSIVPTNKPYITGFSFVGTNLVLNVTNGQSGATYYLLGTTNLLTPLSQWLPLSTNVILTNGSATSGFTFTGTNVVHITIPQQFYILSGTN